MDIYRFERNRRLSVSQANTVMQMKGMSKDLSEQYIEEAKQRLLENQLGTSSNTFLSENFELVPILDGQTVEKMFDFQNN